MNRLPSHLLEGLRRQISVDPRALGLFRIAFGLLLIVDQMRRWPLIRVFYSNEGTLKNTDVLVTQSAPNISLMSGFSTPGEATLFFGVTFVFTLLFTLGYRTRVFQLLTLICVFSIKSRNWMIGNGGDCVMNLWLIWTLFLPLGRRLSIDAVLDSLRRRTEKSPAQLRHFPTPDHQRIYAVAAFGIGLQFAIIYFFNTVHKSSAAWMDGYALHYVFESDKVVRPLGRWLLETMPDGVLRGLTWTTLVVEGAAPLLILSPLFTTWTRRLAIVTLTGLHLGIYLTMDVGLFSWAMIVGYLLLLGPKDIDLLKRILTRLAGPELRIYYDSDCGVCHLTARIFTRLDRLRRLQWVGLEPDQAIPGDLDRDTFDALRNTTIIVWDPAADRRWQRASAFARLIRALPLGVLIWWICLLPGISHAIEAGYKAFAVRRHRVSAWMGMGECGIGAPATAPQINPRTAAELSLTKLGRVFLNLGAVLMIYLAVGESLAQNKFAKKHVDFKRTEFIRDTVRYTRAFQSWRMFILTRPGGDGHLVIDATLEDGRHVDPQTGRTPNMGPADYRFRSPHALWNTYSGRVSSGRRKREQANLKAWLLSDGAHLELSANDRIKAVKVYWISDRIQNARKGRAAPIKIKKKLIFQGARRLKTRK